VFRTLSVAASTRRAVVLSTTILAAPLLAAAAQRSDVALSPFVTFLPSGGASPLAGLALTMAGNSGLALRASGHLSLQNTNLNAFNAPTVRPWGADADAILFLGGRGARRYDRGIAPYVFAGIGTAGADSLGRSTMHANWSYGAGLSVPVGSVIDVFGESRWRMSRYVLPTARFAPASVNELRFGISLHLNGGVAHNRSAPRSSGRRAGVPASVPTSTYPASKTTSASAARLLAAADRYVGTPYLWGGTTPSGFDCSGFTQYVFAREGVKLPRTSRQQAQVGIALAPEWRAVAPGDLVMFAENGPISHVAIYAGRNRIIHATSSGGGVRYDDLSTERGEWFVDHMVAARRVTPESGGLLLDLARSFSDVGLQLDGPDHAPRPASK
jgi:cell wall-associated NlpC family hydrolase